MRGGQWLDVGAQYRGSSLIRNHAPLGPYSRTVQRALWGPYGGGLLLMSEVPLCQVGGLGLRSRVQPCDCILADCSLQRAECTRLFSESY